eukprot:jgi/Tetstr1/458526/TSEL_044931.t1
MEAAKREAPADIEWRELDGHHGVPVLNVPLGSPWYVQGYMRGKAEELREEVDASRRGAAPKRLLLATSATYAVDARRVMEREAEAASGSQKERAAFLDSANNSRLRNECLSATPYLGIDELKDMEPDAKLSLPAFNVVTGSYDPWSLNKPTLLEFNIMASDNIIFPLDPEAEEDVPMDQEEAEGDVEEDPALDERADEEASTNIRFVM